MNFETLSYSVFDDCLYYLKFIQFGNIKSGPYFSR